VISVLIPVKDDPRLDDLLTEVQAQRTALSEESEVVVIDASAGRLAWIKARHPDVRWVDSAPLAPDAHPIPHQRNEALAAARGDVFVFVDSDCAPSPGWLEAMVRPIRDEGEPMVAGSVRFAGYATVRQPRGRAYVTKAGTQSFALTREVVDRVGLYDESLPGAHDYDLCLRAVAAGFRILFAPDAVVEHPTDPLRKSLDHAFRYGRDAVRLYARHPKAIRSLSDSHVLYTSFYALYVAGLPLVIKRPALGLAIVAPYLVGRPRSVRRQLLNLAHGAGSVVECVHLVLGGDEIGG
jgi:mycofactocin glycosyltransferase